jgi:hypothetical protein
MVSENVAFISARDLSTGSPSAVRRKALVTAARTAKARGYDYFAIVAHQDITSPHAATVMTGPIGEHGAGSATLTSRDLSTDLTVRFLREHELPAERNGIYAISAVLSEER